MNKSSYRDGTRSDLPYFLSFLSKVKIFCIQKYEKLDKITKFRDIKH